MAAFKVSLLLFWRFWPHYWQRSTRSSPIDVRRQNVKDCVIMNFFSHCYLLWLSFLWWFIDFRKYITSSNGYIIYPGLNDSFHDLNVDSRVHSKFFWKEQRRHYISFLAVNPQNHERCQTVYMTVGTSECSAHNHLPLLLLNLWSWSITLFWEKPNHIIFCLIFKFV